MTDASKLPVADFPADANPRRVPCADIQAVLFDYMAHELGDKQSWLVHEHLLHCEACRREAASIKATLDLLRQDTSVAVPERLPNSMRRRLERAILHPVLDWIYEHRRLVAALLAVGIIALLALLAQNYSRVKPDGPSFWINIIGGAPAAQP